MRGFQVLFWAASALWLILSAVGAFAGYPGTDHAAVMGTAFFIGAVLLDAIRETRR